MVLDKVHAVVLPHCCVTTVNKEYYYYYYYYYTYTQQDGKTPNLDFFV